MFIDDEKLSLTGSDKFYTEGISIAELQIIKIVLEFNIFQVLSSYVKYRQDFLDKTIFDYVPDLRKMNITDLTENEFYDLIGLSKKEINSLTKTTNLTDDNIDDDNIDD
jgi:hypothetical protein